MDVLIPILFVLVIFLIIVTVVGHLIWLTLAWLFRQIAGQPANTPPVSIAPLPDTGTPQRQHTCADCHAALSIQLKYCGICGARRPTIAEETQLREIEITLRQLRRLHESGGLTEGEFRSLESKIINEREQILFPRGRPAKPTAGVPRPVAPEKTPPAAAETSPATPPPSIFPEYPPPRPTDQPLPAGAWVKDSDEVPPRAHIHPPTPRKPFAEVLAAFMEQSNIRWGEIIGGLLIIGCSTALVISLWAQISRVPTIKFLIFTTVTAALFGIGFYTEHHWKLPTTSRGILTIATLLVPLNFLAIAAVSSGAAPMGATVVVGEVIAPAIFLCLIYFAGRVIAPKWPHLLAAGALGSSIGQLLIRHLASPQNSAVLLVILGAFPIIFYVAATGWMLKIALADGEIDDEESTAIFITLGTLTFAAILPFALLLYKVESVGVAMLHLAPVVTLGGAPLLATGMLLWQRARRTLIVTRTAGASIALFGAATAVAGILLAWPNPASMVPAALFNFAMFTVIAVLLDEPRAHIVAAACAALAYVIAFHVIAGNVPWQNLRVMSLLAVTASASTGQALVLAFVAFALANEWLRKKSRPRDAFSYLLAACGIGVVSLLFLAAYALGPSADPYHVAAIATFYALGAFWFAWREKVVGFAWAGSVLLFLASAQACLSLFSLRLPWESAVLVFAAVTTAGALAMRQIRNPDADRLLLRPLRWSAIVGSLVAALLLLAAIGWYGFEPSSLLATHALALAAVMAGLLVLTYAHSFFIGFQIAVVLGAVLLTKSYLQRFDWYGFRTDVWLHPWALQTQGIVLGLICLAWIAIRALARKRFGASTAEASPPRSWIARTLLDLPIAFDHVLAIALVVVFAAVLMFGAASGISQELTNPARNAAVFDLAGFPHQMIFGLGSLIVLAILLVVMLGNLRERKSRIFLPVALFVLWSACPLVAGRFEAQFATASAFRWSVAIFLLAVSMAFVLSDKMSSAKLAGEDLVARTLLFLLTLGPLILLTLSPVVGYVNYVPARGPQAGIFRVMGGVALYGLPLVFAVAALAIQAVRARSAAFAFAAGLMVNFTVTCVQVVSVAAMHGSMNRVVLINALQLNAIASACVALVWIATRQWWVRSDFIAAGTADAADASPDHDQTRPPEDSGRAARVEPFLLTLQKFIAIGFVAVFIVPVATRLIALPARAGIATFAAGAFNGWLALALTIAAVVAFNKVCGRDFEVALLAFSLLAAGSLLSFKVAQFGVAGWAGLHVLLATLIFIPWFLLLAKDFPRYFIADEHNLAARFFARIGLTVAHDWEQDTILFASVIGSAAVLVGLRGPFSDPQGAWWSIAALLSISLLAAALNWLTLHRAYLYAAGILLNLALSIWLIKYHGGPSGNLAVFFEANVIALSLGGVIALMLELRARRRRPSPNTAGSFHNIAALWSLLAIGAVVVISLFVYSIEPYAAPFPWLDWLALGSVLGLMCACLWDRYASYAVAGLYLIGLLIAATFVRQLGPTLLYLIWSLMIAAAIFALMVAVIWRARAPVMAWAARLRIPLRIEPAVTELKWLSFFNAVVVTAVVVVAFWSVLVFLDWPWRAIAALAVGAQVVTFGLMAEGRSRMVWQRAAVAMFLTGVVFLGWSLFTPGQSGTWLNRAVMLMSLMLLALALFGAGLDQFLKQQPDWSQAVRDCAPAMAGAAALSLLFVLGTEVYYQIQFGVVQVSFLAVAAVALTLAAAIVTCIFFALSPRHDPLNLSESRRGFYVYVAEVMLVLLFMHIRLTMPWLFSGFFKRYWPLVVLAIAYAGVAISEFFKRRKIPVLAQPIERTGAFLPLLPVIGFWIAQSQVEYSTLLFVVGGLYGLLSILRRSFFFGLAAALAGNGGLWYLLHETSEYHFFQHPQMWLIPAAISVLVAAHLNRKEFTPTQMTSIRYVCLAIIYVSSTADIFINGVARSPWLPLVLAALSIAGVFAGIIFRIQAFLLLGSTFLLLSIATMINYASVNFNWTWLWYVAGIVVGAGIITMFAIFEKKRAEVLRVVDELKDWKG